MGRLPASLMSAENISCSTTSICAARNDSSSVVSSNTEMTLVAAREVPSSHVFRSNTRSRVFCRKGNSILLWSVSSVGMRPMARRRKTAGAWRDVSMAPTRCRIHIPSSRPKDTRKSFDVLSAPFPVAEPGGSGAGTNPQLPRLIRRASSQYRSLLARPASIFSAAALKRSAALRSALSLPPTTS